MASITIANAPKDTDELDRERIKEMVQSDLSDDGEVDPAYELKRQDGLMHISHHSFENAEDQYEEIPLNEPVTNELENGANSQLAQHDISSDEEFYEIFEPFSDVNEDKTGKSFFSLSWKKFAPFGIKGFKRRVNKSNAKSKQSEVETINDDIKLEEFVENLDTLDAKATPNPTEKPKEQAEIENKTETEAKEPSSNNKTDEEETIIVEEAAAVENVTITETEDENESKKVYQSTVEEIVEVNANKKEKTGWQKMFCFC